jgi:tRNA-specific 2-thiouridylase
MARACCVGSMTTRGLSFYTLGQRRGLAIGGRRGAREAPWYVVGKDSARNTLLVSQDANHPLLMSIRLSASPFHWIRQTAAVGTRLSARIRHRQALQACRVMTNSNDSVEVEFEMPQRAAVPGQYLVLYDGEECLGGGEISQVRALAEI